MIRSRALSYLVGVATVWPMLYVVVAAVGFVVLALTVPIGSDDGPPPLFIALFVGNAVTVPLIFGLMVLYLVDLFRNPSLPEGADGRVLWLVLIIVAAPFSMPVYWWQHLRPGSASFARRTSTVTA